LAKREWERELDFSDDELADMGAEVVAGSAEPPAASAPRRSKKKTLRVPVDVVPRKEPPKSRKDASAADALVERALDDDSRLSGPIAIGSILPKPENGVPGGASEHSDELDVDVTVEMGADVASDETAQRIALPDVAMQTDAAEEELDAEALEEDGEEKTQVEGPPVAATPPPPPPPKPTEVSRMLSDLSPPKSGEQKMPPPPKRETPARGLPVDVIAAALSATPRTTVTRADEPPDDEQELSGEELEVVAEAATPPPPPSLPTPPPPSGLTVVLSPPPPKKEVTPSPVMSSAPPPAPATAAPPPPPASAPASPVMASAPPPTPVAQEQSGPIKRRKRRAKAWFEEIFDEDYLRTLPFMTPRQTHREADFIESALELPKGAQLLDLGCGYGRHALELAARGYQVVGLDLSLPLLIRAADEAQRRALNVNFVHGDMRELTFEDQFDATYCVLTTFGYFDDDTNRKVAQGIAKALKPKGKLLLEVLNRDYVIGDLPARVWWEGDGCVVLEEVDFNYYTSRIVSRRSVVFEDGRQLEQEISIRAYSLHELGKVLHHAGFRVTEVSGSLSTRGRFFGASSRELLVVAEKRPG
jgi:SAM-dependent methyltransferase